MKAPRLTTFLLLASLPLFAVLLGMGFALPAAAAPAGKLYVATGGSDAWSGTLAEPNQREDRRPLCHARPRPRRNPQMEEGRRLARGRRHGCRPRPAPMG